MGLGKTLTCLMLIIGHEAPKARRGLKLAPGTAKQHGLDPKVKCQCGYALGTTARCMPCNTCGRGLHELCAWSCATPHDSKPTCIHCSHWDKSVETRRCDTSTTLVVVPDVLVSHWLDEIDRRTQLKAKVRRMWLHQHTSVRLSCALSAGRVAVTPALRGCMCHLACAEVRGRHPA